VSDPEEEAFMHSAEVVRRAITTRERKLLSTLDGNNWCRRIHLFDLYCTGTNCNQALVEMMFLQSPHDQYGIFCCSTCVSLFARLAKRAGLGSKWIKLTQKEYCTRMSEQDWTVCIHRVDILLGVHKESATEDKPAKRRADRDDDVPPKKRRQIVNQLCNIAKTLAVLQEHVVNLQEWVQDEDAH